MHAGALLRHVRPTWTHHVCVSLFYLEIFGPDLCHAMLQLTIVCASINIIMYTPRVLKYWTIQIDQ